MLTLTMGANAPVTDVRIEIVVAWPIGTGTLDCSAYLLGPDGLVRDDADMIFYNQPADASGALRMETREGRTRLAVDLSRVPASVARIALCATVDGPGTMSGFAGATVTLEAGGERRASFTPELNGAGEVAMRLVELYRRAGGWKLRADGQGFAAGLAKLAGSFGVVVEEALSQAREAASTPAPVTPPSDPPASEPPTFDPSGAPSRPSPRTGANRRPASVLSEKSPRVEWRGVTPGPIALTLEWSSQLGGQAGRPRPLRLHLGCFFELADGTRGALQPRERETAGGPPALLTLGEAVAHDGGGGQSLLLDGTRIAELTSLTAYAVIPSGAPSWASASLRLSISAQGRSDAAVTLESGVEGCAALAMVRLGRTPDGVEIERLMRFEFGQPELDEALGWGLAWRSHPR